jgi:hypothetical protein
MLTFFRRLRIKLLKENQFGQYVKYAIGEILLVVIGILIALQINVWNQNRVNRKVEKEIISSLNKDFKANKTAVKKHLGEIERQMNSNRQLMSLIGASREELEKYNIDSLMSVSMGDSDLAFADNTLNNLIQTDRLNLITKDSLTSLLYQWGTLKAIRKTRAERSDQWVNEEYLPYLMSKISFKQMDAYGGFDWAGKSKVKPDYHGLFQEVKFENFLDNTLWYNQKLLERGQEIDGLIQRIIEETEGSLE